MNDSSVYEVVTQCRICGSGELHSALDLGAQFLASNFVESNEGLPLDELRAPLSCVVCRSCGMLQLAETVDRDALFRSYFYRSATNPMMRAALADVRDHALDRVTLAPGDTIVDIGANDGTLLGLFPRPAPQGRSGARAEHQPPGPGRVGRDRQRLLHARCPSRGSRRRLREARDVDRDDVQRPPSSTGSSPTSSRSWRPRACGSPS